MDGHRFIPQAGAVAQRLGRVTVSGVAAVVALHGVAHIFRVAVAFQVRNRPVGGTGEVFRTFDRDPVKLVVNLEVPARLAIVANGGGDVVGLGPKHSKQGLCAVLSIATGLTDVKKDVLYRGIRGIDGSDFDCLKGRTSLFGLYGQGLARDQGHQHEGRRQLLHPSVHGHKNHGLCGLAAKTKRPRCSRSEG